jgi:glycine/D-amino acid oxidase-like deaminating enzyme
MQPTSYQFAIIGGGFFGCATALHLRTQGFKRISVIEREPQLLARASYRNQARVHNGYHYPRSYLTAYRSRVNLPKFRRDYGFALETDLVMLYAIAARRSKTSVRQFEHFLRDIGATYEPAGAGYASLFDLNRVSAVYMVEEHAFDARRLREHFYSELSRAEVDIRLSTECLHAIPCSHNDRLELELLTADSISHLESDVVFNCTYSNLNRLVRDIRTMTPLKHEVAEIALINAPPLLSGLGITVMDGPFFSCMPFPAERCHSLSHVRYTPHRFFVDRDGSRDPTRELDAHPPSSQFDYMIADAARMVPCLRSASWRRSLFEIKTVLAHHEADDGRPILLRREAVHPRLFSILGAKIDNVYDVLQRVNSILDNRLVQDAAEPA